MNSDPASNAFIRADRCYHRMHSRACGGATTCLRARPVPRRPAKTIPEWLAGTPGNFFFRESGRYFNYSVGDGTSAAEREGDFFNATEAFNSAAVAAVADSSLLEKIRVAVSDPEYAEKIKTTRKQWRDAFEATRDLPFPANIKAPSRLRLTNEQQKTIRKEEPRTDAQPAAEA